MTTATPDRIKIRGNVTSDLAWQRAHDRRIRDRCLAFGLLDMTGKPADGETFGQMMADDIAADEGGSNA